MALSCDTDNVWSPQRRGFNGQVRMDELAGKGNWYTATYWEYNAPLGRRMNVDPVDQIGISNYAVNRLNPILFNDPNGDAVRMYDQAKAEKNEPKGSTSTRDQFKIGDYTIQPVRKSDNLGNCTGAVTGYYASKDGRTDYVLDNAGDVADFRKNYSSYATAAEMYHSGSEGMKKMGIGLSTGNAGMIARGALQENVEKWTDPVFVVSILSARSTLQRGTNAVRKGRNIVGTSYDAVKPTQDWINPAKVAEYKALLQQGKELSPIHLYRNQKGLFIEDGHHRFAAYMELGLEPKVIIRNTGGPVGLPNWESVSHESP